MSGCNETRTNCRYEMGGEMGGEMGDRWRGRAHRERGLGSRRKTRSRQTIRREEARGWREWAGDEVEGRICRGKRKRGKSGDRRVESREGRRGEERGEEKRGRRRG